MSETPATSALKLPRASTALARRLGRIVVTSGGLALAAAVGALIASHVPALHHTSPAAATTALDASGSGCDPDGVSVGYDLRYAPALHAFAVDAVRVVGIARACNGSTIQVDLGDAAGGLISSASASATVSGAAVRLPLPQDVSAAAVGRVAVSLAGATQVIQQTGVPAPTLPTETTPAAPSLVTLGVTPTLCGTVSAVLSAAAHPTTCGAVAAPGSAPSTGGKPAPAAAVASWSPGTFAQPVTVRLQLPAQLTVPRANFGAGSFVQLQIHDAAGNPVTQFEGVLALDFPRPAKAFLPLYSEDGTRWRTIPALSNPELAAGQPDGYYTHSDGSITIFTRHATVWALAQRPATVGRVRATPLANGSVRLAWRASVAGLGIQSYRIFRNGRAVATVRTTRTTVGLHGLHAASFQVRATDRGGHPGPLSPAVRARARLVTRVGGSAVTRSGRQLVLHAQLRIDAAAHVAISVLAADGARLPLLTGTRVGGSRPAPTSLVRLRLPAGQAPLVLRLPRSAVHAGDVVRIWVTASAPGRKPRPLVYVVTAPR